MLGGEHATLKWAVLTGLGAVSTFASKVKVVIRYELVPVVPTARTVRAAAVPYRYRYHASVATVPWAACEGESVHACKMGAVMWNK